MLALVARDLVSSDSTQDRTRQRLQDLSALDYIDPNQCCSCFGLYKDDVGTGCEWLQCCCSRWIHEDCVEDIVRGEDGEDVLYVSEILLVASMDVNMHFVVHTL